MSDIFKLKRKITNTFKLSGFLLRSDDSNYLAEQLEAYDDSERDQWLIAIVENLQNQRLHSAQIDRAAIEKAINELNRRGLDDDETLFSVISAFDVPRYVYNRQSKKFELNSVVRNIFANTSMKAGYMRHRYEMLLQKTVRHELFAPSIIPDGMKSVTEVKKFQLLYCENLMSTSSVKEVVVLGLLTQLKEGKFFIEDPTGIVELDLTEASFHSGFYCEGCFVLAEGSYDAGILKVNGIGLPPAELAASSRAFFGTQNSWGGDSVKLLKYSNRLQEFECTNTEATLVFLSDVRLDLPIVMTKLRTLFVGYDACPPVAIILMGPFAASESQFQALKQHLKALADLTDGCQHLKKHTDLILVPSFEDPCAPHIFPRPAIPASLAVDLLEVWPRTQLTTNPCRLQYCTQQITVCRLDLMAKFCRNTLHFPSDTKTIENDFARTLICQGHLAPLNPIALPVHWDFDAALWLYPLPDVIVIGDVCKSFSITQHGCKIINTGSFVKSKFAFKVYMPATKTVDDSEIPDTVTE